MDIHYPVYSEKTQCQDCYKCVRHCPVKAICIRDGSAAVMPERCILCGTCVQVCPSSAKRVRGDRAKALRTIGAKARTVASLAPSFVSHYRGCGPRQVAGALKRLGFSAVSETALGAQAVSRETAARIVARPGGLFLSSACPVAVDYVRKYHPALAPRITALHSPLGAHAAMLRRHYGPDTGVVFFGPCIGKKAEADEFDALVDASLTFEELDEWLADEGIDIKAVAGGDECAFEPWESGDGRIYPVEGGMCETLRRELGDGCRLMALSGIDTIGPALRDAETVPDRGSLFIELLACPGGCVNGPKAARGGTVAGRNRVCDYHDTRVLRDSAPSGVSIGRAFTPAPAAAVTYDEASVMRALERVGKTSVRDELNCGGCGYDTCRDFAAALLAGHAEESMCVSYMRRLAHNKAAALIRAIPFAVVIVDAELRVIDSNDGFVALLGPDMARVNEVVPGLKGAGIESLIPLKEEFERIFRTGEGVSNRMLRSEDRILRVTTFPVDERRVAGALIEDVTELESRREEVVLKARQVITNSLKTVQDIALRLGRNTADSEVILNSIIECFGEPGRDHEKN